MRGGSEMVTALIAVFVPRVPTVAAELGFSARPVIRRADYIPIAIPGRDLCDFQSRCKTDTLMLAVS